MGSLAFPESQEQDPINREHTSNNYNYAVATHLFHHIRMQVAVFLTRPVALDPAFLTARRLQNRLIHLFLIQLL